MNKHTISTFMKQYALPCLLVLLTFIPSAYAYTRKAEVITLYKDCTYLLLKSDQGYMTLKLQDGPRPGEGHMLEGHMDSFGISYVMNRNTGRVSWVYIEDKWSSEELAKKVFKNKCE